MISYDFLWYTGIYHIPTHDIDGLVQERCNKSASAMELLLVMQGVRAPIWHQAIPLTICQMHP